MVRRHRMVTVGGDAAAVERRLVSGRLSCPGCAGVLAGWGRARERSVRGPDGVVRLCPRRARCSGCGVTHVLLPLVLLLRRADLAVVIGAALTAKARGMVMGLAFSGQLFSGLIYAASCRFRYSLWTSCGVL